MTSNIKGNNNVFIGNQHSGEENDDILDNTYRTTSIGSYAGFELNGSGGKGVDNTFIGYKCGYNSINISHNTFLGSKAGFNNREGEQNIYLCYNSGYNNNGSDNVFIGYGGENNNDDNPQLIQKTICIGSLTGSTLKDSATNNTFIGHSNAKVVTTGKNNTFIGNESGSIINIEDENTFFGSYSGYSTLTLSKDIKQHHRNIFL